ncbi:MAG: glycosyltransferase family 39 protein, partial [Candidatus Promineifilaceae bacterium]
LLNGLLALLITYLPGEPPRWLFLAAATLVALIPLVRTTDSERLSRTTAVSWLLVGIFALAFLLRIVNMGYKELQGDEGVIMVRAAAILTGDTGEFFLHQKGPVEILLPLTTWGLTGIINEFWARLPFTWAGLLGVGMVYALGQRWFGRKVGLLAALLLAVCGFGIAFSRIIQYQTLVMLWGGLSLLAADRYREGGRGVDLVLTAVFLAGGLLAHYDAVLVVPAVVWLLLVRLRQEKRIIWREWLITVLVGAGILALFYIPFVLNPNFERTFSYLLQGRVGTDESGLPFSWSGTAVWQMITFYNSLWYILGLIVLVVVALWQLVKERRQLASVLYFLVPALFYTLIVGDPRTHVYTLFPGAALLGAAGIVFLSELRPLQSNGPKVALRLLFGGWVIVSALYVTLLFVELTPERQRTWAENRPLPSLFPTTWDEPPLYGLFGFPHQAGWRIASGLLPDSGLPYASNEEEEITNYYMRQAQRTHCQDFQTFILVANAQDEIPYQQEWLDSLDLQQEVTVNGQVTMRIFGREPVGATAVIPADDAVHWVTPRQIRPPMYRGQNPVDVNLADQVVLAGYDVSGTAVSPGERLTVRLYWQVLAPFEENKQVFVHLFDDEVEAQDDSAPECAVNPTTRWEPGQIIVDPHVITIPADLQPGSLQLIVGMYDLLTKDRLVRTDGLGDSIYLTDVVIQ